MEQTILVEQTSAAIAALVTQFILISQYPQIDLAARSKISRFHRPIETQWAYGQPFQKF